MRKDSPAKFKALLKKCTNIVIVTHWSPDGDAMGSSLALYNYLLKKKKKVSVVVPNEYPDFLFWMPGHNKVMNFQKEEMKVKKAIDKADVIFTLDFNTLLRIEQLGEYISKCDTTKVLIDHHQQPGGYAQYFYYDVAACSTCELIYEFIRALGDEKLIDRKIASCIYTGMMTDTGSFRFPGVTSKTHKILASLLDKGVVPSEIHSAVYDTSSFERMKLLGYALNEKMIEVQGKNAAYISLTDAELKRFNYKRGDTEGLVNYPLSISGNKLSALFTEADGKIKISFRSKGKFDVNQFARKYFNGGGHINAAGGRSEESMHDTIQKFLDLIRNESI